MSLSRVIEVNLFIVQHLRQNQSRRHVAQARSKPLSILRLLNEVVLKAQFQLYVLR